MSRPARVLTNDLSPWDGGPLADGAKIVLQAIGRFLDGRLEDYGPAWVTLKPAGMHNSRLLESCLAAEIESGQPHVFTVRTLPPRPGEGLLGTGAPPFFQKLILLARDGRYVACDAEAALAQTTRQLADAQILVLDLTQKGQARLLKTPWTYKDKDTLPQKLDVDALRFGFPRCDTTILESASFAAPVKADLLNLKLVPSSLTLLEEVNVATANLTGMVTNTDGSRLYGHGAGSFCIIDTASNALLHSAELGTDSTGLAISPDGSKAYMTHSVLVLSVIDTSSAVEIRRVPLGQVSGVAAAADGRVYVTDSYFGNLWKLDKDGKVLGQMQVASTGIDCPVADPADPRRLFVMIGDEKSIAVVDTKTSTIKKTIGLAAVQPNESTNPAGMVISSDGRYLCVVQHPQYITLIDTSTFEVQTPIRLGSPIQSVAFSSDGYHVYVSFPDLALTVRRDNREIVAQLSGFRGAAQLAAHPNNQWLYVSNRSEATLSVVEAL